MMKWLIFIVGIVLFIGYLSQGINEVYVYIIPVLMILVSVLLQILENKSK